MKKFLAYFTEKRIEVIIAIALGMTALFTAWAGWISSLHSGNQQNNFQISNTIYDEGNAKYNESETRLMEDTLLWNEISDLQLEVIYERSLYDETRKVATEKFSDIHAAEIYIGEDKESARNLELAAYKLFYKCYDNLKYTNGMTEKLGFDYDLAYKYASKPVEYILYWLDKEESKISPFNDENFVSSYYEEANAVLKEAKEYYDLGQVDNKYADKYNLVTVIYSLVLFLLGIAGVFKRIPNRIFVVFVAEIAFIFATIFMFTIPLPTGFSILGFFK